MVDPRTLVPADRVHPGVVLALAVADTGNAIPFGLASGVRSNTVTSAEWALSACFAVAAVLLWVRVIGLTKGRSGLAWMVTAGCWAASTVYVGFLPHAVIKERVGLGLIWVSFALAALFCRAREHQREPAGVELG